MTSEDKKSEEVKDSNAGKKTEKQIDKELKDTFPASDPPSGNVFVGVPSEEDSTKQKGPAGNSK